MPHYEGFQIAAVIFALLSGFALCIWAMQK
jgi:hypothetical protein